LENSSLASLETPCVLLTLSEPRRDGDAIFSKNENLKTKNVFEKKLFDKNDHQILKRLVKLHCSII
jgi:hypothetical protein